MKRQVIQRRAQQKLLEREPTWSPPALTPDLAREAIAVLAEMLLEAARPLSGAQRNGGSDDESEDHA
jgi:hypothetical protein